MASDNKRRSRAITATGTSIIKTIEWRVDRAFLFDFELRDSLERLVDKNIIKPEDKESIEKIKKPRKEIKQRRALNDILRQLPRTECEKVKTALGELNPLIDWVLKHKNSKPLPPKPQGSNNDPARKDWSKALRVERLQLFKSYITVCKPKELKSALEIINSRQLLVALDKESEETSLHVCMTRKKSAYECFKHLVDRFQHLYYREIWGWEESSDDESNEEHSDEPSTMSSEGESDDSDLDGKTAKSAGGGQMSDEESEPDSDDNDTADMYYDHDDYVNHKNKQKETVAHLAAKNSQVAVLKWLNDNRFDCFYKKNDKGDTVLKLMYLHAPKAVTFLFEDSITTENNPLDEDFTVQFDFGPIIGTTSKRKTIDDILLKSLEKSPENNSNGNETGPIQLVHEEMALLAELINRNEDGAKFILSHVLVKSFLHFKWDKMKFWFWSSIILRIFFHLIYTSFVIKVFLVDCRYKSPSTDGYHSEEMRTSTAKPEEHLPDSVLSYVFGNWPTRFLEALFSASSESQECQLDNVTTIVAYFLLMSDGILFFSKEIIEFCLKVRVTGEYYKGIRSYADWENLFQIISAICVIWVTSIAYWQVATASHYSAAALGVLISGGLILEQLGNFFGVGLYIQMLNNTITTFFKFMGLYIVMILAFSIAFSITFPHKAFLTLPQAMSKVLVMMIGEFEYDSTFYGDSDKAPFLLLTGQIILCAFAIMLTILLMNLLIGIAVSDIAVLQAKIEVIRLTVKVDQISIMESSLILFRKALIHLQRIYQCCSSCCGGGGTEEEPQLKPEYLDIYVIPYQETIQALRPAAKPAFVAATGSVEIQIAPKSSKPDSTIVRKKIGEIPENLRNPLTSFATNDDSDSDDSSSKSDDD